nr:MAG TPA: hypothetical protein [Caudoviricetes sp.]
MNQIEGRRYYSYLAVNLLEGASPLFISNIIF